MADDAKDQAPRAQPGYLVVPGNGFDRPGSRLLDHASTLFLSPQWSDLDGRKTLEFIAHDEPGRAMDFAGATLVTGARSGAVGVWSGEQQ